VDLEHPEKNTYDVMTPFSSMVSIYHQIMTSKSGGGPTVLWSMLKGKEVMTNDGKNLGEIKEFSQNYVRVEKGTIKKERIWIPKHVADAFDGKKLWLTISEQEAREKYQHGEKEEEFKEVSSSSSSSTDQDAGDLETSKGSQVERNQELDSDLEESIRIVEDYENIRGYK
jgi:hypothetical protein